MTTIIDRIREHLGEDADIDINEIREFKYNWFRGYETFTFGKVGEGCINFSGAYHPNGVCEGNGICTHCGRTLEY